MYLEDKAKYVGIDGANGIVEGRLGTIKAHMKHFLEYVHKDAKVKDLGVNTLLSYDREEETIDYVLFRKRKGIADSTIRNEIASWNAPSEVVHQLGYDYPVLGGLNDGWKTRKAGRYRAEASAG